MDLEVVGYEVYRIVEECGAPQPGDQELKGQLFRTESGDASGGLNYNIIVKGDEGDEDCPRPK